MMGSVAVILRLALFLLWLLIIGRVLLSWFDPQARTQASRVLIQLTEPILAPVRSLLPRTGMLDLSPLIVMLVMGVLLRTLW
jgi:YggT family protein